MPTNPEEGALDAVPVRLAEARTGSTEALGQLLEMCRQYLLGVANRELDSELLPKAGASDIVQEAFLEAQRIFSRFHGDSTEELLAWLRAILLNKLADFARSYRRTDKRQIGREVPLDAGDDSDALEKVLPDDVSSPSGTVTREEQSRLLREALNRLPEEYRQVITWRQWDDLPFEEIARRLDRSVDAARMVWWRAIERLQRELKRTDPEL